MFEASDGAAETNSASEAAQSEPVQAAEAEPTAVPDNLSAEVEDLKRATLQLNRDLLILEEELLFPANTQIAVFLSLDLGEYFRLDAVKLKIDDTLVASHLYTERQNSALERGGIQRLYVGNLKNGEHELTAIFTGMGPDQREYKRGATLTLVKDDDPKMIEIRVYDSSANMQPEFDFKEWEL
ncbi:AraC family transcriptional regulator [Agaribacterium haliotis]|uniref:AraC family transcriptional regulator n=1 Tax=Agaribacterium haliotis TaxID=2013869 RepID=UPI000BB58D2A|nr:AraC family transcriptional regulator [Agaribacterium haliotis]